MTHETKTGDLGGYLARILEERGMTPRQLAQATSIPAAELTDWLTRRAIDPDQLHRAADALGIPAGDLFQAAGRYVPGPLTPEQDQRIREVYQDIVAEQRAIDGQDGAH